MSKGALSASPASALMLAAVVIAALYFGRDILIPLALAILLAFILTPLVHWLRRFWVPRVAAIAMSVSATLLLVIALSSILATQVVQLADNLPSYQRNIGSKLLRLRLDDSVFLERLFGALRTLEAEVRPPRTPGAVPQATPDTPEPVPVEVRQPPLRPLEIVKSLIEYVAGPLGMAGLVFVFALFILLEREELRDRFIRLLGGSELQTSTQLITDAAHRVSRFFLAQLIINVSFGVTIGLVLAIIGVPNAMLWGVLAAVLRFIPYLGPWLAALFPIAIALGSEPGWSMAISTVALFILAELVSNNVVEPWLYGTSTGLSSFAVILAAIFWTSIWGPFGLLLSTPLTVCLVVIGRHVPQLEVLDILLGRAPVLSPPERLYQRLLAGDLDEALDIAKEGGKDAEDADILDTIVLEALRLAEIDRQGGDDPSARDTFMGTFSVFLETLVPTSTDEEPAARPRGERPSVVCVAGWTTLDLAAAELVAARLRRAGVPTDVRDQMQLLSDADSERHPKGAPARCLCFLGKRPVATVKYATRRLARAGSTAKVVVAALNLAPDIDSATVADAAYGPVVVCISPRSILETFTVAAPDPAVRDTSTTDRGGLVPVASRS